MITDITKSIQIGAALPRGDGKVQKKANSVIFLLAAFFTAQMLATRLNAATYYVSPQGDDAASGRSPSESWRSIEKVNASDFEPGDQILFEGGETFEGTLRFTEEDSGAVERPVHLGSYRPGEGKRAVIFAAQERGIDLYNVSWFTISDLVVVGSGPRANRQSGVTFLSSKASGCGNVSIDNLEVSGFGDSGISLGVWDTDRGYRNVRITRSSMHDNRLAGLFSWGKWGKGLYAHGNVYVGDCVAFNMKGGSGLILSSVDGGTIERTIAHTNGSEVSGAAGIWAWDSNNILFQYNESYGNRTTGVDGDGFDFDGGVTNSLMQYNYSHDNDAAGFLLAQYSFAPQPMENITIRYNISENDCRKNQYGAIHVWKGHEDDIIRDVQIYQNTVYLAPRALQNSIAGKSSRGRDLDADCEYAPSAIAIISPTTSASVQNNLFYTTGGGTLVSVVAGQNEIRFRNNAYWSSTDPFRVEWMGVKYKSMTDWLKAASDQERIGSKIIAIHADPMLEAPGLGGTLGSADLLPSLKAYRLKRGSPLSGRGINLSASLGIDPGSRGFYGTPISQATPPAIGANVAAESL
ncbi:hypothetical protein BH09VER1_BH09VER1_41900 [soil metagenome]